MTVPLPDCLNDFAELDPLPKGMSSADRGNSFLIQPGDRHHASCRIRSAPFSATINTAAWVLPDVTLGKIDAQSVQ
jgi:hypothetical protein